MADKLSLADIITHVGQENIVVQSLQATMTNISTSKGVSKVTFVTSQLTPTEVAAGDSKMIGLVLWIPRDKCPK